MPAKTVERAPQVSCYKCGSPDIYSMCHHCAKPMCEKHSQLGFRASGKPARDPGTSGRPASAEFGRLKLDNAQAAVYHCEEHEHTVNGAVGWVVIGAIIAVIGLIVTLLATIPGIVVLVAGVAVAAYGVVKMRGDRAATAVTAPDLPLFPHVRAARVIEYLHGSVDLTEDGYKSEAGEVTGTVTFSMTHSDWQERLRQYRKKYRVAEGAPVSFNAGFAMLRGQVGLAFAAGQQLVLGTGTGLWFRGDTSGHELFAATEGRHEGEWNPTVTYQLQDGRKPKTIPLWIVPSLVPSSDQRTLEIDLHWTPLSNDPDPAVENPLSDDDGPKIELFDRIQLSVPAGWGNMESADPSNAATTAPTPGQKFRIIDWQQVPPIDPDPYVQLRERRSRSLKIRFENPIPSQSTLSGRIEATFEGTLSGVTAVVLYQPGGRYAERQLAPSAKTKVTVDFTISLDAIRYQDDRVIPDENEPDDVNRSRVNEFAGVVPNYNVITALTNEISKDDYYVKSVIENAPYRDDSRAGVLNRVWDIAGRFYTGVFPIDFDIHVRGAEFQDALGASAGTTSVQVTVKGSYATGGNADGSLRKSIEKKWDDLHARVTKVFENAAIINGVSATGGPGSALGQATAIGVGQESEPAAIEWGTAEPLAIGRAETVEPVILTPPPVDPDASDRAERKADLRRQWKITDEAVMTGRISEDVYRVIITRIKAELRDLGEDLGG
jgi:hypothetical protein